jgi:hypothetical protein
MIFQRKMNGKIDAGEGIQIPYAVVERPRKRNIYLRFRGEELVLILPRGYNPEQVISEHKEWIVKHYNEILKRKILFRESRILILGKEYFLLFSESKFASVELNHDVVIVRGKSREAASKALIKWLGTKTLEISEKIVRERAAALGKEIKNVSVRRGKRWGCCTSDKNIIFNAYLSMLPQRLIEYVAVHEASHLVEMNHSKLFWKIVQDLLPDYKELRRELKDYDPSESMMLGYLKEQP